MLPEPCHTDERDLTERRDVADFRLEMHGEDRLLSMREVWGDLLLRSPADRLFCSWDWLTSWWRHHRGDFGLEARLSLAYDGDRLVGAAPWFVRKASYRGLPATLRCELIGNLWRTPRAVISERTGFVVDDRSPAVYAALARHVFDEGTFGELLLVNAERHTPTFAALREVSIAARAFDRTIDPMTAYHVDLGGDFQAYLGSISQQARRQLYNKRKRQAGESGFRWESASPESEQEFRTDLDSLHRARWGWAATDGIRGRVYGDLPLACPGADGLILRRLRSGNETIAAMLGFRVGHRIYELQNAVDTDYDKTLSPGLLQAGFLIEEACSTGVSVVDFLGGAGRTQDYKARLGTVRTELACLHVVRSPVLKALYRLHALTR